MPPHAVGRGVFKGYDDTHFGPDDPVTRGQVVTVMYRICVPEDYVAIFDAYFGNNRPFNNLNGKVEGKYYSHPMNWAYGTGLITGNGSYVFPKQNMYEEVIGGDYVGPEPWETFRNKDSWSEPNVRPDDSVTREELAVMLQRMAKHRGTYDESKTDYAAIESYPDAGSVSSWAREAVAWAVGEGIMGGSANLNPQDTATRAEACKMFEIAIEGKGFTTEGKDKVWVDGQMYTYLPHWTCMYCGAESDYDKNDIEHRHYCAIHTGGTVWIGESTTDYKMFNLGEVEGGQKDSLRGTLESYGLLTGWYEWI